LADWRLATPDTDECLRLSGYVLGSPDTATDGERVLNAGSCLLVLGVVAAHRGQLDRAAELIEESVKVQGGIGSNYTLTLIAAARASLSLAAGRPAEAFEHAARAPDVIPGVGLDHARRHPPRPVERKAARPPRLVGRVRDVLDVELFIQAPADLKQPTRTVLGDRAALALPLRFQRPAALAAPTRGAPSGASRTRSGSNSTVTGASSSADTSGNSRSRRSLASRSAWRRLSGVRRSSGNSSPRSLP
jgi:hypothetical protein